MNLNKQATAIIFNFKNAKILLYPFPFLKKPKRFFSTLPFPPCLILVFDATTARERKQIERQIWRLRHLASKSRPLSRLELQIILNKPNKPASHTRLAAH